MPDDHKLHSDSLRPAGRPYIGAWFEDVSPLKQGILILAVIGDGPAARAGLRRGDLILKVDGELVTKPDHLIAYLQTRGVDDVLCLSIRRNDQEQVVDVTVEEAPLQADDLYD